jgi:maleamate amidohydrolase
MTELSLSDRDRYQRQGFGGQLRPVGQYALLIVDFTVGFADPEILGGGNISAAIEPTSRILAAFRERDLPVVYSRIVFANDGSDENIFSLKVAGLRRLTVGSPASAIIPELLPRKSELVIEKTEPSAFFGTSLASWLKDKRIETLCVAGVTTSGCVRASVVDAMSHGIRPIVLSDCVGDRAADPHHASLFDMEQKYAGVISAADAFKELKL